MTSLATRSVPAVSGTRGRSQHHRAAVGRLLPRPLLIAVNALLVVVAVWPVLYMVFGSVNSDLGIASGDYWPRQFSLANYTDVWGSVSLATGLTNSLLICGAVALVCAVLSTATAWVLVRFAFRGRLTVLRSLVGFQSIPGTLLLLPMFVVFTSVGTALGVPIIGQQWAVFVTYLTFALPFSTWIMVTYVRGLPKELEQAARLDGAGHLRVLVRVVMPLSWPGIVVSSIFAFLQGWNDVLFAQGITGLTPAAQTAAVQLQAFAAAGEASGLAQYGQMMTGSLICAVPVVLLYLVFQRFLVSGLTAGGVK